MMVLRLLAILVLTGPLSALACDDHAGKSSDAQPQQERQPQELQAENMDPEQVLAEQQATLEKSVLEQPSYED